MAVQNELGYCMPVAEVCRLRDRYAPEALVHTDTVQAGEVRNEGFVLELKQYFLLWDLQKL